MKESNFVEYPWIDFSANENMSDFTLATTANDSGYLDPAAVFLLNANHSLMTTTDSVMMVNNFVGVPFLPGDMEEYNSSAGFVGGFGNQTGTRTRTENSNVSHVRYIAVALYLTTFLFGILGNSLTILVIVRNKQMKTVASCFILNLAVADDLFMLSLPFFAHSTLAKNWVFGSVMCSLMSAFYGINLYASIFTMVLMSIDRYLAIVHPLRSIRYRTIRNALIVCACIWIVCIIIMIPNWLYTRPKHTTCKMLWPKENFLFYHTFWTYFELIIGFVLPILIMVVCYMELLRHIVKDDGPLQNQTKKPIKKVTAMVFLVTIVFIVCWTPYHIVKYMNLQMTMRVMKDRIIPSEAEHLRSTIYQTIAQALVFVSSCCNPFIYGISSKNFRRMYISVACKCCLPYDVANRRGQVLHPRASSYAHNGHGTSMALRRFEFTTKGESGTDIPGRPGGKPGYPTTYRSALVNGKRAERIDSRTADPEESQMLMEQSLV